jgi:hypothetical protein
MAANILDSTTPHTAVWLHSNNLPHTHSPMRGVAKGISKWQILVYENGKSGFFEAAISRDWPRLPARPFSHLR